MLRRSEESKRVKLGSENKKVKRREIERKKNALRRSVKERTEINFVKTVMCRTDT